MKPPRRIGPPQKTFVYCGYMNRIGEGFFPKWTRKYFELRDNVLSYYPDDEKHSATSIAMNDVQDIFIKEEHANKNTVLGVCFLNVDSVDNACSDWDN